MKTKLSLLFVFAVAFAILGQGLTIRSAFYLPSVKPSGETSYNQPSLTNGLLAYWRFDTNDMSNGAVLITEVGTNHFTTAGGGTGIAATNGVVTNAARIPYGNYTTALDSPEVSLAGDKTWSIWYQDLQQQTWIGIFDKAQATSDYFLWKDNNDDLLFRIYDSVSGSIQINFTSTGVTNTGWHHVLCWYNSGDKKAYMRFAGGDTNVSPAALSNGPNDGTSDLVCGLADGLDFSRVAVDEFGVWNRILNLAEQNRLATNGVTVTYPTF